jgi:hypothetical protein
VNETRERRLVVKEARMNETTTAKAEAQDTLKTKESSKSNKRYDSNVRRK